MAVSHRAHFNVTEDTLKRPCTLLTLLPVEGERFMLAWWHIGRHPFLGYGMPFTREHRSLRCPWSSWHFIGITANAEGVVWARPRRYEEIAVPMARTHEPSMLRPMCSHFCRSVVPAGKLKEFGRDCARSNSVELRRLNTPMVSSKITV